MNDTTPRMAKLHHDLLMRRTGEERLRMASSMFATARAMALASFGDISETEKRMRLFLRFYGNDFDAVAKERIVTAIRQSE